MDKKRIENAVKEILVAIGEDPKREDLRGTPKRVAQMYEEVFSGIKQDPKKELEIILGEKHNEIVLLKGVPLYSICVGRKMCVYTRGGIKFSEKVIKGDELLTFDEKMNLVYTKVKRVFKRKVGEILEIGIGKDIKIKVTQEHPLYVKNKGWVEARDLSLEDEVIIVKGRRGIKNRKDLVINKDYNLGFFLGTLASDGSVCRNQVRLEVNDRCFAEKFASSIANSFGLKSKIEEIKKPSGFLKKVIKQYRVRVICGELVRIVKDIFTGEKKAKTFHLPQIVLENENIFRGFLHGYLDGDGYIYRDRNGKFKYARIYSYNKVFLEELAEVFHAKIGGGSHGEYELHIPTQWLFPLKRKDFYRPFVPSKQIFEFKNYESAKV